MANNNLPRFSFFYIFITISIFLSSILYQTTAILESDDKQASKNRNKHNLLTQKLSHFTFYWHDKVSGLKPTSIPIITPNISQTGFGMVTMIDNALTEGPDSTSKELGRAQGLYGQASLDNIKLIMMMNFVFTTGKYNGSTITITGSNSVFDKVREMPVVGGSGLFRFGHGYAQARTNTFDLKTGDAVVKYDVYVMHYN